MERNSVLSTLRQQLRQWEGEYHEKMHGQAAMLISSGCSALDEFLPAGGFVPGQLVEWIDVGFQNNHLKNHRQGSPHSNFYRGGSGIETLVFQIACQAALSAGKSRRLQQPGTIVVLDTTNDFYPPAAAAWGVDLRKLIMIRCHAFDAWETSRRQRRADIIWTLDQCLRCPAVIAVWCYLPHLDARSFRRLQLAAEEGGSVGLLIRDAAAQTQPSWADLRLAVKSLPATEHWRWEIEILRSRPAAAGKRTFVELDANTCNLRAFVDSPRSLSQPPAPSQTLDHETYTLHLATQLASPTSHVGRSHVEKTSGTSTIHKQQSSVRSQQNVG